MYKSFNYVKEIVDTGKPVYGINTGFGALSNKNISKNDLGKLQYNLIGSHCTGVGNLSHSSCQNHYAYSRKLLMQGFSGINPEIVQLFCEVINKNITPVVPEKGSVGAWDPPLSHVHGTHWRGEVYFEERSSIKLCP